MPEAGWTADEMMSIAASRLLHDGTVCFVGIGKPSTAANLARRLHAPGVVLVYEAGTIGAKPHRLPLSIGDGELAETATTVVPVPEIFASWLQAGRIDIGFLGAAQLDRHGNINSTVIGPYDTPRTRLPGAGGAPEIAASAKEVIVILNHTRRALVERCDFVTSTGRRVRTVITDLGILSKATDGEPELVSVHPGHTADEVLAATGWPLRLGAEVGVTSPPTPAELSTLRHLTCPR